MNSAIGLMRAEVGQAVDQLQPGATVDLYDWTRRVALRVAMRALFGIDPDTARAGGMNAAEEFEAALSFYARDYLMQIAIMGPTAMLVALASDGFYAIAVGRARRLLTQRRVRFINRASGACLIGGGVWLALSRSR